VYNHYNKRGSWLSIGAEPLTEEQSAVYERLRTWRYERAQTDKVPVYLVAHNASLQRIARNAARMLKSADL
jgi:ribonuclease D